MTMADAERALLGSLPRPLRPKRPVWLIATVALAVAVVVAAAGRMVFAPLAWSPGDAWGLTAGTVAAVMMVVAALYPMRRRLMRGPLAKAQDWLQLHIYGSTLAAVLVLAHTGFRLPTGRFGWVLFGLTLWTTVSGLLGVLLQRTLPGLAARRLLVEAVYERIPQLVDELRARARQTVADTPDVLQRFYSADVEPTLASITPSWWALFEAEGAHRKQLAVFDQFESYVGADDRERLAELRQIVATKLELDTHYSIQRLLRTWPLLHVPPAAFLLAAVIAHVAAVWYF